MLERKITKILNEWKNEENKPCLLVRGARQVGKTTTIEDFATKNYKSYIYINFEITPSLRNIFDGNLDIKTLKMKLEVEFPNTPIIENDTLLFLDEIEMCPNARVALKTFALDGTIDVISSGSLLGLYYKDVSSYPVGFEREIDMYPMDFEEFLWANEVKKENIEYLKECFTNKEPLDEFLLNKFNEYFRMYIITGGMPKVVNDYVKNHSLNKVLTLQNDLKENYKHDIIKYAKETNKQKILDTFNSIPAQLSKKNKKFMYDEIMNEENVGERKYTNAIDWLRDAGIINLCYNLSEPALPLASNIVNKSFKVYIRDTGLLMAMYESGVQKSILNEELYINEGAIIENVCCEELITRYGRAMYFERKSTLEIDFILNIDGVCTALELKSGNNKQAKSLTSIINNYKTVTRYIKLEKDCNIYVDEDNIEHYPLFMIMFL